MRAWYVYSHAMRTTALAALLLLWWHAPEPQGIALTQGMVIEKSTRIRPGVYRLRSSAPDRPAITVRGNDIALDLSGVTIEGGAPFADPDTYGGTGLQI